MKFNWKHSAGAFALSVAMLASTGGQTIAAAPVETGQLLIKDKPKPPSVEKGKSDTIKPNPPSVEKGKSATIPVELPTVDAPATEKGIRDNGVKGCGNCGLTGKEAAPPPVDDGAAPAPSVDIETGQLLIKDKPTAATERRAHNGSGGTPPSTAKNELCGLPYTAKCVTNATAKKGSNTGLILGITAGAAALAAVLASGNNNDRPTSP